MTGPLTRTGGPAPDEAAQPAGWLRLDFPGLRRPLIAPDDPALLSGLGACLNGWRPTAAALRPEPAEGGPRPLCAVVPEGDGRYRLHSTFLDEPLAGLPLASAVCGIVADLSQAFYHDRPECIALHCGAVHFPQGLVAFSGRHRSGKSTLVSRLTAERELSVYCDDVLPLMPDGTAFGLGIAPRLRLPLPATASPRFRAHVAEWMGPSDARYGYIAAPTLARHGSRARLAALVALDRRDGARARLHRLDDGEAVGMLVRQCMSGFGSADTAYTTARDLAGRMDCLRLVYSDLEDAVALLRRAFGRPGELAGHVSPGAPPPVAPPPRDPDARGAEADTTLAWKRETGVAVRRYGQASFLWRPGNALLWQLNPIAGAVWALLELPGSARDMAEALAEAFPDIPQARLEQDVARLLAAMRDRGLVRAA